MDLQNEIVRLKRIVYFLQRKLAGGGGGGGTWGSITGTLSAQTDLQSALDAKVTGPASATNNNFPQFDGTTGKLIKNSSYGPSSFVEKTDYTHSFLLGGM